MSKNLPIYIFVALLGLIGYSCNSDVIDETQTVNYNSVAVTSFVISADTNVAPHLDSVFFSIDLVNAKIYNADSLPAGADVSKLVVSISTATLSACELYVTRSNNLGDTVYDYLSKQTDSIDFTYPVTMRCTSYDGKYSREYEIKVNVHNIEPDSLYWNEMAKRTLPTCLSAVEAQKSIVYDGKALCLTRNGSSYSLAVADNPSDDWTATAVSLPDGADIATFSSTTEALFVVASGKLYASTDMAVSWNDTGLAMNSVFGGYADRLLGAVENSDGSWDLTEYPSGSLTSAPEDFPVTKTSALIVYSSEWSNTLLGVMACGQKADGTLTEGTWGFDGNSWALMSYNSERLLPAVEGITLVPYFAYNYSYYWYLKKGTVILAMGGRMADGNKNRTVYISYDRGVTWRVAGDLLQLPDAMPTFYGADALVFYSDMDVNGSIDPAGPWQGMVASRWSEAVTEWDCPYIYLFGGKDINNNLLDTMWKGVINRLSFVPLY